jgi:hypothetical protein
MSVTEGKEGMKSGIAKIAAVAEKEEVAGLAAENAEAVAAVEGDS